MPDGAAARSWYRIEARAQEAEIWLFDEVGLWGVTAKDFITSMKAAADKPITLRINSPGGDVWDSLAIFNALKAHKHPVTASIEGIAASAASFIAMAASEVRAAGNSHMMLHDPHGLAIGTAGDMRRLADTLDRVKGSLVAGYRRSGKPDAEIEALMAAESWFTADEAQKAGFVDVVEAPIEVSACFDLSKYANAPPAVLAAYGRAARSAQHREAPPMPVLTEPDAPAVSPAMTSLRAAYRAASSLGLGNDLVDQLLDAGVEASEVPAQLIEVHAKRQATVSDVQRITPGFGSRIVRDERETLAGRITDALHARIMGREPPEHARELMGKRLQDMAEMVGTGGGRGDWFTPRNAPVHTTSDFPLILGTSAQRSLMDFYAVAQSPMLQLSRRNDSPDFRARQRVRLGEAPQLLEVLEAGEVTAGTVGEAAETLKLATFGRIWGLSRTAIVDDDLSAFSDQLRWWAGAVASLEASKLVAALDAVMSDTKALFHLNHGNLAASGSAITTASISAGRQAMRLQKGLGGVEIVGAPPVFLLCGAAKETEAQSVLATLYPPQPSNVNVFSGVLSLLVEPRIAGNTWHLFASPTVLPTIEHSYLSQQPGPTLETRQGFEVLGSEFRVVLDFAAGPVDWRGCWRDPGAATLLRQGDESSDDSGRQREAPVGKPEVGSPRHR